MKNLTKKILPEVLWQVRGQMYISNGTNNQMQYYLGPNLVFDIANEVSHLVYDQTKESIK